jgi:hypothetical protein
MLKAEVGLSLNVGTQKDTALNTLLSDMQKWLASEFDWPFLADRWDVTAAASSRLISVPTTAQIAGANQSINFERPVTVQTKWNTLWQDVDYGIGQDEFNYLDSDRGITADPVQRWQMAGQDKFEIWPMPASPQIVRFQGQRALAALTADGSLADLDDVLIVLFVAAEMLANEGMKNAPIALAKAQERLARLRGVYPARQRTYIVGSGSEKGSVRIVPMKIVPVHG